MFQVHEGESLKKIGDENMKGRKWDMRLDIFEGKGCVRTGALKSPSSESSVKMRILVTGGAGFVGMHTSLRLLSLGHDVIVYDSMSEYYSTALKHERVKQLLAAGAVFVKGDVCDAQVLRRTLAHHQIGRVIHLAAQAGVRHSLDHPLDYVESNIRCFVVLLEAMVSANLTSHHLVYASSSSVYGLNTKVPFTETDAVVNPASLYAATKASTELIARAYYNLHKLNSVGLRFFTVYGPWGRPDMAYFSFTDDIINNRSVTVFHEGELMRDFTYISDIVDGIVSSLSIKLNAPEIINLGNSKPVQLMDFLRIIERHVGWPAKIEYKGMMKGDVPTTFADIRKAKCLLGYAPSTELSEGIRSFVLWFQEVKPLIDTDHIFDFCIVSALYFPKKGRGSVDSPVNLEGFARENPSARFFLYTNDPKITAPGWQVVEKQMQYRRSITQSRWPKFMAWQDERIQKCRAVFYADAYMLPTKKSGDQFRFIAEQLSRSKFGIGAVRHPSDKGGGVREEVCLSFPTICCLEMRSN